MDGEHIFALVMIFVCLLLIAGGVLLSYFGFTHKNPNGSGCSSDGNCSPTQVCINGVCNPITCDLSSQCPKNQICTDGFCSQKSCNGNGVGVTNACATGSGDVCVNGLCTPIGTPCSTEGDSSECFGGLLACVKGKCAQCGTNGDCESKGLRYCVNGACQNNCVDSAQCAAQDPLNPICVANNCCPEGASDFGRQCSGTRTCTAGLSFCVNEKCTCRRGKLGEQCFGDACEPGLICFNGNGGANAIGVCAPPDAQCTLNFGFKGPDRLKCRDIDAPYCNLNTYKCSSSAVGAACQGFSTLTNKEAGPYGVCNLLNATGGLPDNAPGNFVFSYCVNGRCQVEPGWLNDKCTVFNDCSVIDENQICDIGRCGIGP